ncbi:transcriptional regulatory protein [Moritella sp. PE36]|uniref:LysR family transcriptional regulator n=1 Tax=Moritella sp. PE36 TaxID=58051 RepID=UPI0001568A76|nr:LysR family transcriptional regulator [Moritella sp. PE36]EDM69031.1 transcriptional regulatory protein [Moritella sp. PE36]
MDLKSLKYFVAAVDSGSITGASKQCFVAQPSITIAINKLEAEFDTVLLTRHKKGVTPTSAGQQFYQHSKALLNQAGSMFDYFNPQQSRQTVTIAVQADISLVYLKRLMSQLQQHCPQWLLHLTSDSTADIYLGSDCQDINLGNDNKNSVTTFRPLWRDQYYLIIPNNHALAFKTHVTLEQLHGVAMIERRQCKKMSLLMDYMRELQIERVASVDTEEWALALVEQQIGLLLAPLTTEQLEHENYTAIPISNITGIEQMERQVGITLAANRLQQPDFMALVNLFAPR